MEGVLSLAWAEGGATDRHAGHRGPGMPCVARGDGCRGGRVSVNLDPGLCGDQASGRASSECLGQEPLASG